MPPVSPLFVLPVTPDMWGRLAPLPLETKGLFFNLFALMVIDHPSQLLDLPSWARQSPASDAIHELVRCGLLVHDGERVGIPAYRALASSRERDARRKSLSAQVSASGRNSDGSRSEVGRNSEPPPQSPPREVSSPGLPIPGEKPKTKDPPSPPKWPDELATDECREAWGRWIAYRRERKFKRYSAMTVASLFAKFAKLGPEKFIAAIENSITNGYQGVIEPRVGHAAQPEESEAARNLRIAKEMMDDIG